MTRGPAAGGGDAERLARFRATVLARGRELYRDGRFLSLDYPSLLEEAASLRRWARGR